MANFRIRIAAALAALAFLLPAQENSKPQANGGTPADATARPRGPTIGVVDLDKARDQYPRNIAEREGWQRLSQQFQVRIDEMTKRIEHLQGELSLLKEGSGEREMKLVELELAMGQRKGLASVFKGELNRARDKSDLLIYQDLETAVAQVAKDRGVQIVLRVSPQDEERTKDWDPLDAQQLRLATYNRRAVWFAADEVDLTPALIKYLQVLPIAPKPEAGKADAGKTEAGKTGTAPAPKPAGNGNGGL